MPDLTLELHGPLDLVATLGPLRHGPYDPTISLGPTAAWRASRTPDGPSLLHLRLQAGLVIAEAWGPGRHWELEAVPGLIGAMDDPGALRSGEPRLTDIARRFAGARLTRTCRLVEALLPAICEQKVTSVEDQRVYRSIVRAFGEPAPAPAARPAAGPGLWVPPSPARLAALPYHAFHPLGLERRRAEVLRTIGRHAAAIEAAMGLAPEATRARLMTLPGIGPWTAAEATRIAMGDPDAVSLGDYHLPALVAWTLAGERHADDGRMLELLEPYAGQRARVVRLLELGASGPPRRGPRLAARSIEAL